LCEGSSNHDDLDQIELNLDLIYSLDQQVNIKFDQMGTCMLKIKLNKIAELSSGISFDNIT
jgi:hypothetical protein